MIRILQTGGRWVFVRIEAAFTAVFGERWNPWFQLGALSFYFFPDDGFDLFCSLHSVNCLVVDLCIW